MKNNHHGKLGDSISTRLRRATCDWFARSTVVLTLSLLGLSAGHAQVANPDVAQAGFAYSGDAASIEKRFPFSRRYEQQLKSADGSIGELIRQAIALAPPQSFSIVGRVAELKGQDQALVVALVINTETVSVEEFGKLRKLLVLVKGQALFFDFKSMAVVRAYPLSFAAIDVFDRAPTDADILARVRLVYEGSAGKPGIFTRYANALAKANLPNATSRYLQVTRVSVRPEAGAVIPEALKIGQGGVETWVADIVGEALSTRAGVPIIPFANGHAIGGVMPMSVADGEVYNLKLPKSDYEVSVELTGFKKVKYAEVAAGASFIFGSYATIKIEEPMTGRAYLNTALKNGEVKMVPSTQTYVDDFPAFYDAFNMMFVKLGEALDGKGNAWLATAAATTNIDKQVADTKELIKRCK